MLRFSAFLACVTGIGVVVAVAAINLGVMPSQYAIHHLSSINVPGGMLIVIVTAVLLTASGAAALSRRKFGPFVLTGAWGFVLGISFFAAVPGLVSALTAQNQDVRAAFIIFLLWAAATGAAALAGLVTAIIGSVRAFHGH